MFVGWNNLNDDCNLFLYISDFDDENVNWKTLINVIIVTIIYIFNIEENYIFIGKIFLQNFIFKMQKLHRLSITR